MRKQERSSSRKHIDIRHEKTAAALIVLAGVFWGSQGIFANILSEQSLSSMDISAIRIIGTALAVCIVLLLWKKEYLKIRRKDLWVFAGSGICSIICFNYCYYQTIELTSMSVAAVLLYTSPVFVMLLSNIFFHERMTKRKLIALIVAFTGCVCVSGVTGESKAVSMQGILTGISAGFAYALYSVFSRAGLKKGYTPLTVMAYTFFFAGAGMLLLTDCAEVGKKMAAKLELLLLGLAFVIVTAVIPYALYTIGMQRVETGKAAVMASAEAAAATLFGVVVFGERITWNIAAGIGCVVFSILILNKREKLETK